MRGLVFAALCASVCLLARGSEYPQHWWKPVPPDQQHSWEIPPQAARPGEVILSKRNELGIFSNFGLAPFVFDGKSYASIEGLWQMMKFPDPLDPSDPRHEFAEQYPASRAQVALMHGFEAKKMGDAANEINRPKGINWVSYKGKRFNYKDYGEGSLYHYDLIKLATVEKVMQNPKVKELLIKTKGLVLKPDHAQGDNPPPSYEYFKILMEIRKKL